MRVPVDIPAGLNGDDTSFAATGRWADGSNVRFRNGRAETIGGWESVTTTLLTGVCRTVFPFTDNANNLTLGLGTHSKLQLWQGGALYDITPTLALPSKTLGANPIATHNGTPTVDVTQPGHPFIVGDSNVITGATAVATVTINGTWTVTAVTANTWSFTAGSNANATTTGGGSAVVITPQRAYAAGQIDGTGSSGFGTGGYGVGGYGLPSTADYFPRTWSFGAWGQNMLASPRSGTIYSWDNDTGTVAHPLADAPAKVSYMLVAPNDGGYQVFALGCNREADGVFDPMCIRHSSVAIDTEWTTADNTTAREYKLTGGGRLVAGRMVGPYLLAWTNDALFLGEFIGDLTQVWKFTRIARNCGLLGPNAVAVLGQTAYWVSADRQFYRYALGGQPEPMPCQIREDFADNLAASQGDKVVASTNAEYSEVRFDYPDQRDESGYENSRYLTICVSGPDAGSWYRGSMARTAFVDAGPAQYPIAATYDGNLYFQEKGHSADGGSFSWFIESADQAGDENAVVSVQTVWPDLRNQIGPVNITVNARFYPQDDAVTTGPMLMAVDAQKVDFRLTGRLFSVRFEGNSAPSRARLGKFDFDVYPSGTR